MADGLHRAIERDRAVLWHPATHLDDEPIAPPVPIASARGAWLYPHEGPPILDAIASWWTSLHGHGHPHIVANVQAQVAALDHVMFAGFTHAPAIELAERVVALAGPEYERVFFSDCGSAALEIALKLAFHWHALLGRDRPRFAALEHGYHGETLGALAVCGTHDYRTPYAPILPPAPLFLPTPSHPEHRDEDLGGTAGSDAPELARACALLDTHRDSIAALVLEPIVQCAGRMRMHGTGYVRGLVAHARSLGILVIGDEIAVGFGRTGRMLASSWAGVQPDLLCLGKGLSGGLTAMGATVVRAGIAEAFRGGLERSFLHSHTFTANPIACAGGVASLEVFARERTLERARATIEGMAAAARVLAREHRVIRSWRQAGDIVAFELDPSAAARSMPDGRVSLRLRLAGLGHGVLLRPLHDVLYWMPPLCLSPAEIAHLEHATSAALREVFGAPARVTS